MEVMPALVHVAQVDLGGAGLLAVLFELGGVVWAMRFRSKWRCLPVLASVQVPL